MLLAYGCFIFGKEEQAMEVCEFLQQYQFMGDYSRWGWIEGSLALYSRLLRKHGKLEHATVCVDRIQATGFQKSRLSRTPPNIMTSIEQNVKVAQEDNDHLRERDWRIVLLKEQCTVIEMGGSTDLPQTEAEAMFQSNLTRIKELVGALPGS